MYNVQLQNVTSNLRCISKLKDKIKYSVMKKENP